jgi:hypothetical protein
MPRTTMHYIPAHKAGLLSIILYTPDSKNNSPPPDAPAHALFHQAAVLIIPDLFCLTSFSREGYS